MRKAAVLTSATLVAVLALVLVSPALATGKTHDMTGTVVSVDPDGKKLTFKDDTGTSMTVPVLEKAAPSLKSLKAGQKVVLTCQDNEKGDHEGVSAIRVEESGKS
jgi:Cu/Ag efflux protein CusF